MEPYVCHKESIGGIVDDEAVDNGGCLRTLLIEYISATKAGIF